MFQVLLENLFSLEEGIATSRKRWVDSTDSVSMDVFNSFVKADPSPTKKYLDWMLEQHVNQKESLESISGKVASFDKAISRNLIQNKDIYKYETLKDLEKALQDIEGKKTKTEIRKEEKIEGAEKIYEDENVLIVSPKTHKASCYYGKGTKWCTTETSPEYFDNYRREGATFYYLIDKNKNEYTQVWGNKWAVVVLPDGEMECFNEQDDRISSDAFFEDAKLPIEKYGIDKELFKSVESSLEEILQYSFVQKTWETFFAEDVEYMLPSNFSGKLKKHVLREIGSPFYVASDYHQGFPRPILRYWLDFIDSEEATFYEERESQWGTMHYFGYVLEDGVVGYSLRLFKAGEFVGETSYLFVKDRKAFVKKLLNQEI